MKFFFDLAYALLHYPKNVLFKLVGCFVSYQFSAMVCVFVAGMSANAGFTFATIGFSIAAAVIYGVKGNPVAFWRGDFGGGFPFGRNIFED